MKLENNFVSHNNYDFLFSVIYTALTLSRGESWSKSLTKQVRFPSFFLKEFCRFCRFFCSTLNSNKKKNIQNSEKTNECQEPCILFIEQDVGENRLQDDCNADEIQKPHLSGIQMVPADEHNQDNLHSYEAKQADPQHEVDEPTAVQSLNNAQNHSHQNHDHDDSNKKNLQPPRCRSL